MPTSSLQGWIYGVPCIGGREPTGIGRLVSPEIVNVPFFRSVGQITWASSICSAALFQELTSSASWSGAIGRPMW